MIFNGVFSFPLNKFSTPIRSVMVFEKIPGKEYRLGVIFSLAPMKLSIIKDGYKNYKIKIRH